MRHLICAVVLALAPSLASAQDKVVPVPPNIKAEGLPPIPQSIADDLARYAEFRDAQLVAWHPSKRQILVVTRFGTVPQLHVVDGPGRARTQLTFLADGVSPTYPWAKFDPADPSSFVFRKDAERGKEAYNLYRFDLATGAITLLTNGKSRYAAPPMTNPVWSRQGKWLAYDSTERDSVNRDLYVMQPADPKTARRVLQAEGNWGAEDWSPDSTALLAIQIVSPDETRLWRVDVKTGDKKPLTPGDEKSFWSNPRFSADGRSVYAISDRDKGITRLWRSDAGSGAWTAVSKPGDIVDNFEISPDGLMVALRVDRGDTEELQVLDLGTLKPRPLPPLPAGVVRGLAWRPGSRELGFTLNSLKIPGDVYSVDTSLGTLTRWTSSEVGAFNPEVLPAPEVIQWKSFDGRMISGILYRPPSRFTGPRPVIVNIHGGPMERERARFLGRSNYFLNELGVSLIYPNVRGSIGFGREFAQLDDGKGREGAIKDIGGLLDWVGTRADLDKDRIMLTGGSYGGYLALEAGIYYSDRIRCVYEGAGMTNIVTFMEQTDPARVANRRPEYGDERDPDMRAFMLSISPISRASDMKKPLGIAHPGTDTRVPVSQAQELVKALKANGTPVWYMEYTDVGHDNFPGTLANYNFNFGCWILFAKTYLLN
jgi:dipeptidyl aminopeptidase/acylaminoacyl peptidase